MSNQPLVSVLTPVYNNDKYIAQCIESVLSQTYQNWEYVIVNNRSTDQTLEIAESYARRDPRIRIHTNEEFVGIIPNHNIAFRQIAAESAYCKVVHADDWLFPECIAQMVALAEANPTVGLVGAYRLEETRVTLDGLPYPSTVVAGREIGRLTLMNLFGGIYIFGSPTSTMIRADLIRKRAAFYNEANINADTEACLDVLRECDFGFVHQVLTFTRRHNESNTSVVRRFNTHIPGGLTFFKNFAPYYLDPAEYNTYWARYMAFYYDFLSRSLLKRREQTFWDYHKQALTQLGTRLDRRRLWSLAAFMVLDHNINPVRLAMRAIKAIRQGFRTQESGVGVAAFRRSTRPQTVKQSETLSQG